jgi:polyphosphate kinase 2
MKKKQYEELLEPLELELNNVARWLARTGKRLVIVFEGRDTAGKGGVIHTIAERLNPRQVHVAALATPSERERSQWYFQRYIAHLPSAGEIVMFDRSWYNRAGVERVMGYCTDAEYALFLKQVPEFERMLVEDGILLFKYWLTVDQQEQETRFTERAQDPLKRWKLSPIDLKARELYAEYGRARADMLQASHKRYAPWYLVDFNDQRRGRLNLIRHLLDALPDLKLEEKPLVLPPLRHKPLKERYGAKLRPIRGAY